MRDIITAALAAGIRHRYTKNGIVFYGDDGENSVVIHFTQSDHRAHKNTIARFRKIGFDPTQKVNA